MKSFAMRLQMFFIAAAINLAVCIGNSFREWVAGGVAVNPKTVFVSVGYINCCFGAIAVVCALGCVGILLTNVLRRRKELAVHITSGACGPDVFKLVALRWTMQAAIVPTLLGLAGSTLALRLPLAQSWVGIPIVLSPLWIALSFFGIILFAFIVALYPAIRAMRLSAIEALAAQ